MNRMPIIVTAILLAATTLAETPEPSPYAGLEGREIKALSPDTVAGYLAGHGMGFAMAAELNSYPGPKHVMELAEQLDLDEQQARKTGTIFDEMHERSVGLGAELVAGERRLDELFASVDADEESVHALVGELGRLRAELRYAHLRAHLQMREILTVEQIRAYDRLRGYGTASAEECPHASSGHGQARPGS